MPNDVIQIVSVISSAVVSIIATGSAIYIARLNRQTSTTIQFRKVWIDSLTEAISSFIAMAEMIAMLDIDNEDKLYLQHFKELSRVHNKVLLMLNPLDKRHIKLGEEMEELREIIHDDEINEDDINEMVDSKVINILETASEILKTEWNTITSN